MRFTFGAAQVTGSSFLACAAKRSCSVVLLMACAISTALPLARHIERMSSSNFIYIDSLGGAGGSFFLTVVQSWLGRSGATVLSGACTVVPMALVLAVVPGARRSPVSAGSGASGARAAPAGGTSAPWGGRQFGDRSTGGICMAVARVVEVL